MKIEPIKIQPAQSQRPATSETRQSLAWPIAVAFLGVVIAAAVFLRGGSDSAGGGDVVRVTTKATRDYVNALAVVNETLATEVEAGQIDNRKALFDRSEQLAKAARKAALMPLAELENARLPEGQWDESARNRAADHFRQVAKGHRGAIQ